MKMKTGLKSIAAAAIAAFTFGFAPSAMAASITISNAQQRYPWNGQFDITYTASGIAEACGSRKPLLQVWAVNPATHVTNVATAAALSGDTTMSDGTHSLVWNMDTQGIFQGVTNKLEIYVTALAEEKSHEGVQLWANGPYFATTNIGADNPEDYGYYFWWGDTVGYKRNSGNTGWISSKDGSTFTFKSTNCPTRDKTASQLATAGYIYSATDTRLKPAYDAAQVHWGSTWRMMTDTELQNLTGGTYCSATSAKIGGVSGWLVTGKTTGYTDKSIFLPAAGYGLGDGRNNAATYGYYWASAPDTSGTTSSRNLKIYSKGTILRSSMERQLGCSIRPVSTDKPSAGNGEAQPLCTGKIDAAADLRTGKPRNAAATETLTYTTDYSTGGDSVTITVNGSTKWSGLTGSGTVEWTPDPNFVGEYSLQHKVYKSGSWVTTVAATFNSPKEELELKDAEGNTVDVKLNRTWAAEKTGTTDPTAQAEALNVKQDNGHRKWENEILGLNGSVSTSIPVISPVQTSDAGKVGFRLSGVNVDTTSGASVSNKVWKGATPGEHTTGYGPYLYTEQVDVPVPESGVQYYDIEVLIK